LKRSEDERENELYSELVRITQSKKSENEKQNERFLAFARHYGENDVDFGRNMLKYRFNEEAITIRLTQAYWQIQPHTNFNQFKNKGELANHISSTFVTEPHVDIIVDVICRQEPQLSDIEREFWENCTSAAEMNHFRNIYRERWKGHLHIVIIRNLLKTDADKIDEAINDLEDLPKTDADNDLEDKIDEAINDLRLCGLLSTKGAFFVKGRLMWIARNINALTDGIIALFGNPKSPVDTNATSPEASKIHLSKKKGMKVDYIRVINCLYELGFFKDDNGKDVTKKDVFAAFGAAVNQDLSDYCKDLSRSLSDSTALDKHLKIFDLMKEKMTGIFNAK
jgi:hypothetical protein